VALSARTFLSLNVIPFFVPPLRDRKEDIPFLAKHFLNEFSAAYGRKTRELTDARWKFCCGILGRETYGELRNLVERWSLLPASPHRAAPSAPEIFAAWRRSSAAILYGCTRRAAPMSVNYFAQAAGNRWNMTQTATTLGLERSHLYRKMKSLGIAGTGLVELCNRDSKTTIPSKEKQHPRRVRGHYRRPNAANSTLLNHLSAKRSPSSHPSRKPHEIASRAS